MSLITKLFGSKKVEDPTSKLDLHEESLEFEGVRDNVRVWYTRDGDGIGLYYFGNSPDLPVGQKTVESFCEEYQAKIQASISVVEVGIQKIDGLSVVRTIGKVPQTPTGMSYIGSYTIPFRDSSYVIKIQCEERGTTGIREAILFDRGLNSGEITIDDTDNIVGDFAPDDEVYDKEFPDHPLSRCRRGLFMITSSLFVAEDVKRLPGFDIPAPS